MYALNYVKDRNSEKHVLLEHFTLKGIIQIANRAAYKIIFFKSKLVLEFLNEIFNIIFDFNHLGKALE